MTKKILEATSARRKWSDDEKLSILAEVGIDGSRDSDVARRYGLPGKRFYQWRTALRRKGLWNDDGPVFLPVEIAHSVKAPELISLSFVEITLCNGRSIRFEADAPDELLARLIRMAEAA